MKRFFTPLILMLILSKSLLTSQECSADITKELQTLYTAYAESKSVNERAKYCIEPDLDLMKKYYNGAYTPKYLESKSYRFPEKNVYFLFECKDVKTIFGTTIENTYTVYFKKIKNSFKIDWKATVGYNPITLTKVEALTDYNEREFRCSLRLASGFSDDYYIFKIDDTDPNKSSFSAMAKKDSKIGKKLMDMFKRGDEELPMILKLKGAEIYGFYSFEITDFVTIGWCK